MKHTRYIFTRQILLLLCAVLTLPTMGRNIVVKIKENTWQQSYGGDNIRKKVEKNLSRILTAIDNAANKNATIEYSDVEIQDYAIEGLNCTWDNVQHFYVDNSEIEGNCLKCGKNLQIRDIKVTIADPECKIKKRAIVITFNRNGGIESVILQPSDFDSSVFMREGADVEETDQRLIIQQFVERFRNYYVEKNLDALRDIFSEDALIITGVKTKIMERHGDGEVTIKPGVRYDVKGKEEYIKSLEKLFSNTRNIDVQFSDIKTNRHPTRKKYYSVRLIQDWTSNFKKGGMYKDKGSLYLLWDFTNPEEPKINIRKWSDIDDETNFRDFQY